MKKILTTGRYFRQKLGMSVYKVPVSIVGFTCPNIDGTVARGGCIYCENESFSPNFHPEDKIQGFRLSLKSSENPFLDRQLKQLDFQVKETMSKLRHKFKAKNFLIYFQSFTNTYAPFETLKALYEKALSYEGVVGLSIGTRSDSMSDETLAYLGELAKTKEIWVEYGVQSIHEHTLEFINRGHGYENAKEYILKTKALGINVCTHLIFGLPNESQEMMLQSAKEVIGLGVDALKIHPLYVTKRTRLAQMYENGEFEPISEDMYVDTLVKTLHMTPPEMMIQRTTAGTDSESLIAPLWCKDLKEQRRVIRLAYQDAGIEF